MALEIPNPSAVCVLCGARGPLLAGLVCIGAPDEGHRLAALALGVPEAFAIIPELGDREAWRRGVPR